MDACVVNYDKVVVQSKGIYLNEDSEKEEESTDFRSLKAPVKKWLRENKGIARRLKQKKTSLKDIETIIESEKEGLLKFLVEKNIKGPNGKKLISVAIEHEKAECFGILLKEELSNKNDIDFLSLMELAIEKKSQDIVKLLLYNISTPTFLELVYCFSKKKGAKKEYTYTMLDAIKLNETKFHVKDAIIKESAQSQKGKEPALKTEDIDLYLNQYKKSHGNICKEIKNFKDNGNKNSNQLIENEFGNLQANWKQMEKSIKTNHFLFKYLGDKGARCYEKTFFADAHNHFNGIIRIETINSMLTNAIENWEEENKFDAVPKCLVKEAETLPLKDNNFGKWIDSLDAICRIIVFSILDIENDNRRSSLQHTSYMLKGKVGKLLSLKEKDGGRGMNVIGILLSSCITLRFLLETYSPNSSIKYYQEFDQFMREGEPRLLIDIFKKVCLVRDQNNVNSISKEEWFFTELKLHHRENTVVNSVAKAAITSAFSSSLWAPFDDCYALRELIRCDYSDSNVNETNWTMLTLKWLCISESACRKSYYSEISIGAGSLPKLMKIILGSEEKETLSQSDSEEVETLSHNLERFELEQVKDSEFYVNSNQRYSPLLLRSKVEEQGHKEEIVAIRFFSGEGNHKALDPNRNVQNFNKKIQKDAKYKCWAGIDMYGMERFSYTKKLFHRWLSESYEELKSIIRNSKGKRSLWLRPHVGEGSWVTNNSRITNFDPRPEELFKNKFSLNELLPTGNNAIVDVNAKKAYEIMEFIYRAIFKGWLPIDTLDGRSFEIEKLGQKLGDIYRLNREIGERKKASIEQIGAANLKSMIEWISKTGFDLKNSPMIRLGHVTQLKGRASELVESLKNLKKNKKFIFWVDLNLGSNIVTAARTINSLFADEMSERRNDQSESPAAVKQSINSNPFNSSIDLRHLIVRSKGVIGMGIKDLVDSKIKFVLGTDGQGVESSTISEENQQFYAISALFEEEDKETINRALRKNEEEYLNYGIYGDREKQIITSNIWCWIGGIGLIALVIVFGTTCFIIPPCPPQQDIIFAKNLSRGDLRVINFSNEDNVKHIFEDLELKKTKAEEEQNEENKKEYDEKIKKRQKKLDKSNEPLFPLKEVANILDQIAGINRNDNYKELPNTQANKSCSPREARIAIELEQYRNSKEIAPEKMLLELFTLQSYDFIKAEDAFKIFEYIKNNENKGKLESEVQTIEQSTKDHCLTFTFVDKKLAVIFGNQVENMILREGVLDTIKKLENKGQSYCLSYNEKIKENNLAYSNEDYYIPWAKLEDVITHGEVQNEENKNKVECIKTHKSLARCACKESYYILLSFCDLFEKLGPYV